MLVLDPGHLYELMQLDMPKGGERFYPGELRFVKRVGPKFPGNGIEYPGTTLQEVLRCCVERCYYLNKQERCWQTRLAIPIIKIAIWLFEIRAAWRHHRPAPGIREAVYGILCPACGHVGCKKSCRVESLEAIERAVERA